MQISTRWHMLLVLFLARTSMAYQFQSVPSAGPQLIDSLGISFTQLGTLIGLYMLPGIALALPSGLLGRSFGAERMVLVGLMVMAAGGALMGADSIWLVFTGRIVSGLGAVFINVLMTKMVTDWFADRDIVPAMAVFVSSWPLGLALGLLSFPPLAAQYGVGAVMYLPAVIVAICLVLVVVFYRAPDDLPPARSTAGLHIDLSRREWLLISLAGLIWGSFNASHIVLVSFLPDLFALRGYAPIDASRKVSLMAWAIIVAVPLAGYLSERIRMPNVLMAGGFAASATAIAVLPFTAIPSIPFALIIVVIGVPAGLIMALPAQSLRPQNRATGMGIFYTWHFASMAVLPSIAGSTRDITDSVAAPLLFAAATLVVSSIALLCFRLVQRRIAEVSPA
jgi:cyanate permease